MTIAARPRRVRLGVPVTASPAPSRPILPWSRLESRYAGKTVAIIGGGDSLRGLPLAEQLSGAEVLGCNDAYQLGPWVQSCIFGDQSWWAIHGTEWVEVPVRARDGALLSEPRRPGLLQFPGRKITLFPHCNTSLSAAAGVDVFRRANRELRPSAASDLLGWYLCTGACAIGYAVRSGARRVVLFGYDMKLSAAGNNNWHTNLVNPPDPRHYPRFAAGFRWLSDDLKRCWPGVEVVNANPQSNLAGFPKVSHEEGVGLCKA